MGVLYLLLGSVGFIPRFLYKKPGTEIATRGKDTSPSELESKGFIISRSAKYGGRISNISIYVDDIHKKFAVKQGGFAHRKLNLPLRIFLYSDLLHFELNEDGNTIEEGKRLGSAVGALTFGLPGAIIGAAGARKSQSTCNSLVVRIMVNDLHSPQIIVPFISSEIKKGSVNYKLVHANANGLMAILYFIQNQSA